jgi:anthranilate/para-aminobenzoate synthase component I
LEGGWEEWGLLADALAKGRRDERDQAVPSGGLAGIFHYDGSFSFYECPVLEEGSSDQLWRQSGLAGGSDEVKWESRVSQSDFEGMVVAAQERIRAGDIYQINLTRRVRAALEVIRPYELFRTLWTRTQSPWAGWLQLPDRALASASPELFLSVDGRQIRTQPIKGTRPRHRNPTQDQHNAFELITDPKEVAELVMITDLERNDLGQVCEFGSVEVGELVVRRSYSHVHHLVSTIDGLLRADVEPLDAVRACFPGGSITGAPKGMARRVIAELEPESRGCYTGAMGYLGYDGSVRLSMVIRCLEIERGEVSYGVGSGLTIDSDPAREFHETTQKGSALQESVGMYLASGFPARHGL